MQGGGKLLLPPFPQVSQQGLSWEGLCRRGTEHRDALVTPVTGSPRVDGTRALPVLPSFWTVC